MFRLPVCPHCGTIYRYRDTKKAWKQKKNICYHCEKPFSAKLMPYAAIEALILLPLCIGFNILLLNRMIKLDLIALFAATGGFILLGYLLFPYFVHFIKPEPSGQSDINQQKNRKPQNINRTNQVKNQSKKQQNHQKRRS